MKHRSSEPGASVAAVTQLGAPVGRTLIFCSPKANAIRPPPNVTRVMPSTCTYQSTQASTSRVFRTTWSMRSMSKPTSHPVRHARTVLTHRESRDGPADDGQRDDHRPVHPLLVGTEQRGSDDVDVVQQRVELDDLRPRSC